MTTPGSRANVSTIAWISRARALGAALAVFTLGACARVQSATSSGVGDTAASPDLRPAIRFDNEASVYVDLYLVADQRQWRLGRVMPGGRGTFRLPEADLARTSGFVRLAVLANASTSLDVARDPRALLTIAQPVTSLVSQGWAYSLTQSSSPQLVSTRVGRR